MGFQDHPKTKDEASRDRRTASEWYHRYPKIIIPTATEVEDANEKLVKELKDAKD